SHLDACLFPSPRFPSRLICQLQVPGAAGEWQRPFSRLPRYPQATSVLDGPGRQQFLMPFRPGIWTYTCSPNTTIDLVTGAAMTVASCTPSSSPTYASGKGCMHHGLSHIASVTPIATNLRKNIIACRFDTEGIIHQTAHGFRHVWQIVLGGHLFQEQHHVLFEFDLVCSFIFRHTVLLETR